MRAVVQRVKRSSVKVNGEIVGSIENGIKLKKFDKKAFCLIYFYKFFYLSILFYVIYISIISNAQTRIFKQNGLVTTI